MLLARQLASPAELSAPPKQLVPLLPVLLLPPSGSHCVWLRTLKASARNPIALCSVKAKCLNNPVSRLKREGLLSTLRCAVPKVRPSGEGGRVVKQRSHHAGKIGRHAGRGIRIPNQIQIGAGAQAVADTRTIQAVGDT